MAQAMSEAVQEAFYWHRFTGEKARYMGGMLTSCPVCAGQVAKTARACPHCGHDFTAQPTAQATKKGAEQVVFYVALVMTVPALWSGMVFTMQQSEGRYASDLGLAFAFFVFWAVLWWIPVVRNIRKSGRPDR